MSRLADELPLAARVAALVSSHQDFFDDHPQYMLLFHQARGMLQLRQSGNEGLRATFADYLARLGCSLISSQENAIGWTDDERIDVAAAVAGAIAGYRSFRIAAGLRQNPATVRDVLSAGVTFLLEHRGREVKNHSRDRSKRNFPKENNRPKEG